MQQRAFCSETLTLPLLQRGNDLEIISNPKMLLQGTNVGIASTFETVQVYSQWCLGTPVATGELPQTDENLAVDVFFYIVLLHSLLSGVFVGSGIFKSAHAAERAKAIVQATTHYKDAKVLQRFLQKKSIP